MKFLTTNALANHQIALVLCRALKTLGPRSESELKNLLVPNHLMQQALKDNQWRDTLAAVTHTELVSVVNGRLVLTPSLFDGPEITHENFATHFLRGLIKVNLDAIKSNRDTDDLFEGIVWLISVPEEYMVGAFDVNSKDSNSPYKSLQDFGFEKSIIRSDQWVPFRRWARGLGLLRQLSKDSDSVDISDFVIWYLRSHEIDGPIENFVEQISELLPLVGSNQFGDWYRNVTGRKIDFNPIGDQLCWALNTCEHRRLIELNSEDDARVTAMSIPNTLDGSERLITHIRKIL